MAFYTRARGGRRRKKYIGLAALPLALVALAPSAGLAPEAHTPASPQAGKPFAYGERASASTTRTLPGPQLAARGSATPGLSARSERSPFVPGAVLLAFHPGTSQPKRSTIERSVRALSARHLGPKIRPVGKGAHGSEFLEPIELEVRSHEELAVVARLRRNPAIAYAEPDYYEQAAAVSPNDPEFASKQWADNNTGQTLPSQNNEETLGEEEPGNPGYDDNALAAWQVTTGSRSIVVAELDTGVDYTHPDLKANIWTNPGGIAGCPAGTHGFNMLSSSQSCNPNDEDTAYHGHGTHVAGIIGAVGNNGIGVTGLNWQTTIMPVKWFQTAYGGETSALISAMQTVIAAKQEGVNVRVINDSGDFTGTASSTALAKEIETLNENNILFVSPAGNNGTDDDETGTGSAYPCDYDEVNQICVTSDNDDGELPAWASYGPRTVDLAAPGESIYSTQKENGYGFMSGTSVAVPQVSGAAALILSVKPGMSAAELKSDITSNVDPLASLHGKVRSGGTLDVCKAIPGCKPHAAPPPIFGSDVLGSTKDTGIFSNYKLVNKATLSVTGKISRVRFYAVPGATAEGTETLKAVIYANSDEAPGALLATGTEVAYNPKTRGSAWINLPFSSNVVLNPGTYWLGFITGGTSEAMGYLYASVEGSRAYDPNNFLSGPSDPFETATIDSEQASLYATYTPVAAAPSPPNEPPPTITGTAQAGQTGATGATAPAGGANPEQGVTVEGTTGKGTDRTSARCASANMSRARILSLLSTQLVPSGKGATIAALLEHGGYDVSFRAPGAGAFAVSWYLFESGGHRAARTPPQALLYGARRVSCVKKGAVKLEIRLTAKGRRLMRVARQIELVAQASFTPAGRPAIVALKTISLAR